MNGPREGWLPCPGNNCGDPLAVTTVDGRLVSWPAQCPSCRTPHHLPPEGMVEYDAPAPLVVDFDRLRVPADVLGLPAALLGSPSDPVTAATLRLTPPEAAHGVAEEDDGLA